MRTVSFYTCRSTTLQMSLQRYPRHEVATQQSPAYFESPPAAGATLKFRQDAYIIEGSRLGPVVSAGGRDRGQSLFSWQPTNAPPLHTPPSVELLAQHLGGGTTDEREAIRRRLLRSSFAQPLSPQPVHMTPPSSAYVVSPGTPASLPLPSSHHYASVEDGMSLSWRAASGAAAPATRAAPVPGHMESAAWRSGLPAAAAVRSPPGSWQPVSSPRPQEQGRSKEQVPVDRAAPAYDSEASSYCSYGDGAQGDSSKGSDSDDEDDDDDDEYSDPPPDHDDPAIAARLLESAAGAAEAAAEARAAATDLTPAQLALFYATLHPRVPAHTPTAGENAAASSSPAAVLGCFVEGSVLAPPAAALSESDSGNESSSAAEDAVYEGLVARAALAAVPAAEGPPPVPLRSDSAAAAGGAAAAATTAGMSREQLALYKRTLLATSSLPALLHAQVCGAYWAWAGRLLPFTAHALPSPADTGSGAARGTQAEARRRCVCCNTAGASPPPTL